MPEVVLSETETVIVPEIVPALVGESMVNVCAVAPAKARLTKQMNEGIRGRCDLTRLTLLQYTAITSGIVKFFVT